MAGDPTKHSWLMRDGRDRERMIDMDKRIQPVRTRVFIIMSLVLLALGPWTGWWVALLIPVAAVVFAIATKQVEAVSRPEVGMFFGWATSEVLIAIAAAAGGGPHSMTVCWLGIPLATLCARFSNRGIYAGVGFTIGLLALVTFGVDARAVINSPDLFLMPLVMIIAIPMFCMPMMNSDRESRADAGMDQLTGLHNRKALTARIQAFSGKQLDKSVSVVMCDLDHFKTINDTHGHDVGDQVLRAVARVLRENTRSSDTVYRYGGEEFCILLPGSGAESASSVADKLREIVSNRPLAEQNLTMSFGVAECPAGESFSWEQIFQEADQALYRAKSAGRNQVALAA